MSREFYEAMDAAVAGSFGMPATYRAPDSATDVACEAFVYADDMTRSAGERDGITTGMRHIAVLRRSEVSTPVRSGLLVVGGQRWKLDEPISIDPYTDCGESRWVVSRAR